MDKIHLIYGTKGCGKTKKLVDLVLKADKEDKAEDSTQDTE